MPLESGTGRTSGSRSPCPRAGGRRTPALYRIAFCLNELFGPLPENSANRKDLSSGSAPRLRLRGVGDAEHPARPSGDANGTKRPVLVTGSRLGLEGQRPLACCQKRTGPCDLCVASDVPHPHRQWPHEPDNPLPARLLSQGEPSLPSLTTRGAELPCTDSPTNSPVPLGRACGGGPLPPPLPYKGPTRMTCLWRPPPSSPLATRAGKLTALSETSFSVVGRAPKLDAVEFRSCQTRIACPVYIDSIGFVEPVEAATVPTIREVGHIWAGPSLGATGRPARGYGSAR